MSNEEISRQKGSTEDNCCKQECKGRVMESNTMCCCKSECRMDCPQYMLPVVISEMAVQIDTESKIKLGEPAIEIKRIKKNVFLTECRLVGKTRTLFLKGYVRKNIEYATPKNVSKEAICGDIKHTTVQVPFHCVTEVDFIKAPQIYANCNTKEITYTNEEKLGRDIKETDFYNEEFFNEKVYGELISAHIHEADIVEEYENIQCIPTEQVFQSFIEKEVVCLSLRLLQRQQVYGKEFMPKRKQPCMNIKDCEEEQWFTD